MNCTISRIPYAGDDSTRKTVGDIDITSMNGRRSWKEEAMRTLANFTHVAAIILVVVDSY